MDIDKTVSNQRQYIRPSQTEVIPSDLVPFFLKKSGGVGISEESYTNPEFAENTIISCLSSDKVIEGQKLVQEGVVSYFAEFTAIETGLTTAIEAKSNIVAEDSTSSIQNLIDFDEFEYLNLSDISLNSDIDELINNLKQPQGLPYLVSLSGKISGPKDLSKNKRKYLVNNARQKTKK